MTREEAVTDIIAVYGRFASEFAVDQTDRDEVAEECLTALRTLGVTDDEIKAAR